MSALSRDPRPYTTPPTLDRAVELSRINFELIAYVALIAASILAHLWALGVMAMHHDESIHAWMSWKFFTGEGGFVCAGGQTSATYCYDPVYHGPSLYVLTLLSYFLFGVGEAQARLPQAIAGIALVGSCWMLRPLIGRRAAFIAAVVLAFAPSILYYTRFARHDGLMLLWTFWIVVGFFRFLQEGRARWLYLLSVGAVLAVATHELYYILIFLFGFFLLVRLMAERLPRRQVTIFLAVLFGVTLLIEILTLPLNLSKTFSGIALLLATVSGTSLLMLRVWDTQPLLTERMQTLWQEQRNSIWIALGVFLAIYVLLFSTFFTYPRGIIDGAYQGISYWLGSQQAYARGKQPWYYYLMLLPVYEPLSFFGSISVAIALFLGRRAVDERPSTKDDRRPTTNEEAVVQQIDAQEGETTTGSDMPTPQPTDTPAPQRALADSDVITRHMVPLFLAFWFIGSLVAFSWAGEKMPWLVTHIALPGNLLIAWGLSEMFGWLRWRELPAGMAALVPATVVLLIVALAVMLWRFSPSGSDGLEAQTWFLAGIIPLAFAGGLLFALLTIIQRIGWKPAAFLSVLTIAALLGAYMIRASWLVVYDHPDTPRELLIYTQTTPEVPLIVNEIREIAVNQTRNQRSASDPIGGNSMPVIMDIGGDDGDGSLAWPFQWYLRDFQRLESRNADFFRNATASSFDVEQPDGITAPAQAVLVYSSHVTPAAREALEANYVKRYDARLNWWFPEGDLSGCNPDTPGYKQFYYSTLTINQAKADPSCQAIAQTAQYKGPLAPIGWLFDRSHWSDTWRFLIWRDLPEPLRLDGREMQFWVRNDLVSTGSSETTTTSAASVRLLAEQVIGQPGSGDGQLLEPRGVATDSQNNLYVADTGNNRIVVYGPDGAFIRAVGSYGAGDGQFNEPRGIAIDSQDNLYVADTWNARVVKFDSSGQFLKAWGEGDQDFGNGRVATATDRTEAGNAAAQLGMFGPRGVAVDADNNVYIADTGNRRIVVTDSEGNYRSSWGYEGSGDGQFNEPIGVAVDSFGSVYVADVWNGRVQVFAQTTDGQVDPLPSATWSIPGWEINTYDDPAIAAAPDGTVYVSVPSRNQAASYTSTGQPLLRWGGAGSDFASFSLPSGLSINGEGNVFVVDRGNGRVLEFAIPAVAPATP